MKLTIRKSVANEILETMNKALGHKYLRKIPKKNGKGWYYIYAETFLKPFRALREMFGLTSEKISEDYERYNINADYGVDKKGFASHVLEYFSNKIKWDTFFSKKEEREKHQKPTKNDETVNIHRNGTAASVAKKDKPTDNKIKVNRSLMRKVYSIYNRAGEKQNEQTDNVGAGSGELQIGDKAVRRTGSKGLGDFNVPGGGRGDDRSSLVQPVIDDGRRTGRNARLTKTATINIREACLKLLEEKTDSEMTAADKDLLRQYEGAGGLGEESATIHGTLYEYYTPEKVVKKVWDLVEKHTGPGIKNVLEPAAGIGRFAENKDDTFTLCEIDKTSARISKILHPTAEVKQGAFQELFMSGGISKKEYSGKKYDVVIGNPPYGKYEGLYKGRGEGKEHARYEEYFIDRGLDTLREGGILSFVVPSSFLRGKGSIIKEKIAKKARLLEAWRLPNGTFNTTGVGTDIIILRKEKGELSDFSENNYFEKNPQMIVGDETIRNGKFGEEKYVKPKDGETFDQAIERIKVDVVETVLVGEKTDLEKIKEIIETKVEAAKTPSEIPKPSRILSSLIPLNQLAVTRNNPESYANEIERLNASVKKIPKLYDNDGLKKHPVALHYFAGNTDFYASEWDGKDTFFGYTILNGDRENAEWGYMSLSQIMSIPEMNLDYHQTPGMIEDIVTQKFSTNTGEQVQSEAESTQNRSNAMKGNQNAKKDGAKQPVETDTLESFNKKYNRNIPAESLPIWKATAWDGKINTRQLSDKEKTYIEKSGNYIADKDGNLFNKINFASGNIYAKLEQLESDKEALGEKEYNQQKEILYQALPPIRKIGDFSVSPISDFAKSITFKNDEGQRLGDLRDMFIAWAKNGNYRFDADDSPVSSLEIGSKITFSDIEDYVYQRPVIAERSSAAADRETNKMIAEQTRELRKDAAERIFNRFILEGLSESDKQRIETEYNKKYNAVVNPDYTKIPIFIDGIANTHHGKPLEVKDQQLKGVSFACNKGNGVIAYDVGVGKAGRNSEKILTPTGWTTHGTVKEGDFVIAADGCPAKVIKVFPQGEQDIYRITFSDGATMECTKEHLWDVQMPWNRNKAQNHGDNGKWATKELQEIMGSLRNSRGERKYSIPMCGAVQFQNRELDISPYLMGLIIGNGSCVSDSVNITLPDDFTVDIVKKSVPQNMQVRHIEKYDYRLSVNERLRDDETGRLLKSNPIIIALEKYGLMGHHSYEKFIPDDYKYASLDDRLELLCGLMDADGYVDKRGATVLYYTTSVKLAFDVKELVQSFGGTISQTEKQGKYKKDGKTIFCRTCYCLSIKLFGINPFKLPRKRDRVKDKTKYIPVRYIDKVEYVGCDQATCILIDHPSHLYVTNDYVVTHNTMVGIMATVSQLQSGRAKKPLVCVPKAVYKNWVKTIKNLFPAITINELGNLNKKYTGKNFEVSEGTISVCTYEALQNITFKQETIEGDLLNDILESQVTESEDKTKRQGDIEREKIMTMLGVATKTNKELSDGAVYWEDLGIDHITVDEVHNFKNVFAIAKPTHGGNSTDRKNPSRLANEFQGIGGSQSARGLKMFALTQLIQKENNDRNVFALSATPFTNSPIEIYNILSLVARKKLKDAGIYNLHEFMAQFAELKTDWVYKANGEITRSQVMKNFKNLTALQSLITEYIDKVDGEEAGVLRPKKITHISEIGPTALQKQIIEVETKRMTETTKDDKGAMLVAINNMRMAMLSPALVKGGGLYQEAGIQLPKANEIVTSSPKLTFTCDSVVKAYQNNAKNSQIIYMPRGVEEYPFVKQYLVERGIPADAIAFMNAKTSLDAKEKIKNDFNNVDGTIKVIIGSETIKEGVSLNGNTTTLYNTFLGWNPTESIQVEGRIHRQGNKQGHTHIIYPLMNDSVDSVMYQKHDEKSSRLNDLYSYKGDKLNVEDVDPEELKFALIKDPEKRAKFKIDMLAEEIEAKRSTLQAQMDILFKNSTQLKELEHSQQVLLNMEKKAAELKSAYEALKQEVDKKKREWKKEGIGSDWRLQQTLDSVAYNLMSENDALKKYKKEVKIAQNKTAAINEKFEKMGIKTNADVDNKMNEMREEIADLENQISGIRNDREKYIREAKLQIAAETKDIPPLDKLVDANVKSIITNLRPMKEVEQEILVEKKMKKSIRVLRRKTA